MERLGLKEAAEVLGISEDGVRKRVKRQSIPYDRDEDGKLYVYLDPSADMSETEPDASGDMSGDASGDSYAAALIEQLRSENEYLREEGRRKDHIIMTLAQRVPELEAPPEPRESPETASEEPSKGDVPERRSWWKKLFSPE